MSIGQKTQKLFLPAQLALAAAFTLAVAWPQVSLSQTINASDTKSSAAPGTLSGEVSAERNVKAAEIKGGGKTGKSSSAEARGAANNKDVVVSTTKNGAKNNTAASVPTTTKARQKATPDSYLEAQLAREKNKHHQYYEGLAKNVSDTGQYQAARLRVQASTKPAPQYVPNDNVYIPPSMRVPGYTPSNSGLPPRSPVYVSQDLEYAKMKEDMAREKAERLRKVSAEKEALLDQTMDNMKSQMKDSRVPGGATAKPEGTNLFVRYYGPSPSSKPYEVHPAAARIVPHQ